MASLMSFRTRVATIIIAGLACGFVSGVGLTNPAQAGAACCRYVVEGCGKSAKVCVQDSCNSGAETRARKAFEGAYRCNSTKVTSHIGTCTNERCDLTI
jgi:hypothetical protein